MATVTLLHAAEQLVTAAYVTEEAACDCSLIADADLTDLIDVASDIIAIATNGWVKGRVVHTYRPVWRGADCWPEIADVSDEDGIPVPYAADTFVVVINGVTLAAGEVKRVRVDDLDPKLVRINASTYRQVPWPKTNRPYAPNTEAGTFELAYVNGVGVETPEVQAAAAELVCHLAKDWDPGREARRTKAEQVSVGGATMTRRMAAEKVKEGRFDLRLMDRMLAMFDRSGGAQVWSPELATPWTLLAVS